MRLQNPFAALDTTGVDSQVLVVLARTERFLTVSETHALIPEPGSSEGVRKSVGRLVEQGTALDRITGRSSAFALNLDHLLAEAILKIVDAKYELLRRLEREISGWPVQPVTAKPFDSAARNEMVDSSDIDIFVVMPDGTSQDSTAQLLGELSARAAAWTGNGVRPLAYLVSEVRPASIFTSALNEGIDISGDSAWLRRRLRGAVS